MKYYENQKIRAFFRSINVASKETPTEVDIMMELIIKIKTI